MKEIPMPFVKSNQTGIVLFSVLAILLQSPWLIAALWVIQALGLAFGLRLNAFVKVARPFLKIQGSGTQSSELTRFNNVLAVTFLTLSLISLSVGMNTLAYVFVGMLAFAAFLAICGYCIGCTVYFQFKQLSRRFR
jgi:hypothetical protein